MLTFTLLLLMSFFVFHVPVKGSFGSPRAAATLLYVFSTCGFGQLVSTFTQTQVAAVFATTVLAVIPTVNFSGLLVPVSSLTGHGKAYRPDVSSGLVPADHASAPSPKALGFSDLWFNALVLAAFALGYLIAAQILLRKQEA